MSASTRTLGRRRSAAPALCARTHTRMPMREGTTPTPARVCAHLPRTVQMLTQRDSVTAGSERQLQLACTHSMRLAHSLACSPPPLPSPKCPRPRRYVEGNPSLVVPPEVAAMPCLAHSRGYAEGFKAEMVTYK